ncbi:diaminopropionate ammonia-lyase [Paenibacillus agricola]|uniref:Diaminopropionate ammonia-lyase n=1 Tax=Paenibacillus agricola TaxID=2716264 RepID=A0ABX0J9Z8_9BACL|nr:diaminopropionate ammonia-lyase [Paenibacillus agricola]NHN32215.1 diaminopropionate ammonia-lyase [Paenibacillus agricola]
MKFVRNPQARKRKSTRINELFGKEESQNVIQFHRSFPQYAPTPLVSLKQLAQYLGVKAIYVKDESQRFGLGSFKVLGGAYAIGRCLAQKLGQPLEQVPFDKLQSSSVRETLGTLTFATATDGNHGRGVAWTAKQLGHKSVVYMPKGSSLRRLQHIQEVGADVSITDWNYDDSVRHAAKEAATHGWEVIQDTSWEGYVDTPTHIMQGYTTMANEALEQLVSEEGSQPTHVFVQAGVGAFAGAVIAYLNAAMDHSPTSVVIEPHEANCLFRTCEAGDGKLHRVEGEMNTIMAGLACGEPNPLGWEILSEFADMFVSLPDSVAARGMRVLGNPLLGDAPVISGESGAVTAGFLSIVMNDQRWLDLRNQLSLNADSIVLLFNTEGDTDPEMYRQVVWNCECD